MTNIYWLNWIKEQAKVRRRQRPLERFLERQSPSSRAEDQVLAALDTVGRDLEDLAMLSFSLRAKNVLRPAPAPDLSL